MTQRRSVAVLWLFAAVAAPSISAQSARDEALAREAIAIQQWQRGELAGAIENWRVALRLHRQTRNARGQAAAMAGIGSVYLDAGELDSAFANFHAALAAARAIRFDSATTRILTGLGAAHAAVGRVDSALAYYRLAIDAARRARDPDNEALSLQNIGSVYSGLGRTDSALFYLRDALSRFERSRGQWAQRGEAMALSSMGGAYYLAGLSDSASRYLHRALAARRALGDRRGEATTLGHLAAVQETAGRLDSAAALLEVALPIHQRTDNRSGESYVLRKLGLIAVTSAESGDSTASFAGGMLFLGRALEIAREASDSSDIAISLQYLATAWRRAGFPERAVAYYDSAAVVYARLRRHLGSDANAIGFGETEQFAYWPWSLALLQIDEPIRAWAVAERGRAQAVLDLMSPGARARRDTGPAPNVDPLAELSVEAIELWRSVRGDSAHVLYYLVAGDTLTCWLLTPDGSLPFRVAAVRHDSLAPLIAALRWQIGADSARRAMARGEQEQTSRSASIAQSGQDVRAALRALSDILLPADLLARVPAGGEIILVPHGALGLVPFAALQLSGDSVAFGVRHPLRYAPSLRTLAAASARNRPPAGAVPIVVGNPAMPEVSSATGGRVRLSELPGAAAEAAAIANHLRVLPWSGTAASEERVRRALPTARIVHLATHGLAFGTEARVRDSYVALAPDGAHDGLLTLGEIMDDDSITLAADLVVLSACQTGLGDLKQAEGTIGLQRGLLAKGARSVLVSLWSVDDEATRFLMEAFYQHWLGGTGKSEALRRAQNAVRTDAAHPRWSHPRYWAAFQLVGAR